VHTPTQGPDRIDEPDDGQGSQQVIRGAGIHANRIGEPVGVHGPIVAEERLEECRCVGVHTGVIGTR